jgi:GGDEF domain-containing protein
MQSYCTYYTEKYVEQKLSLNPSRNLLDNGYDYYECVRILENDTNDMHDFLLAKRESYPNFRSSQTGYTYKDLCAIYSELKKYEIPKLYAYVLDGPQIRDGKILQEFIANSIADSQNSEAVGAQQRSEIERLIASYVEKNAGILKSYFTEGGDNVSSNYILGTIEDAGAGEKAITTYDNLILELVGIDKTIAADKIDRQFLEETLTAFQNVSFGGTEEEHAKMEQMINDYENELQEYYEIVNTSSKELNLYISADYLKMVSSVRVAPSINIKLYIMLALVLFFVIGCCGAVLLGRLSDIVDYLLYVDKKTGLPNREKLNIYIGEMAGKVLPEAFTCFTLNLDNLSELTKRFGYTVGDGVLKDFAGLVQLMGDTEGMRGYNGVGRFVVFFEECSSKKAAAMIRILDNQVEEYNSLNPEYPIRYTAAWATTEETDTYEIRELLRLSQKKWKQMEKEKKDKTEEET